MAFCRKCGAKLPDGDVKFCRSCGTPVEANDNAENTVDEEQPQISEPKMFSMDKLLGRETAGEQPKVKFSSNWKTEEEKHEDGEKETYRPSYSAPPRPKPEADKKETCPKCGRELYYGACPFCDDSSNSDDSKNEKYAQAEKKFRRYFADQSEEIVGVLGNTYFESFLNSGEVHKAFAVVSSKRVYFRGTTYEINAGKRKVNKTQKVAVVDLCDVTGTEMIYTSSLAPLITGIVFTVITLISIGEIDKFYLASMYSERGYVFYLASMFFFTASLITALISYFIYFKNRRHTVNINYGGGGIAYDLRWFSSWEVEEFQKKLHLAKDKANEERYGRHE